jgi:hypothetical protein
MVLVVFKFIIRSVVKRNTIIKNIIMKKIIYFALSTLLIATGCDPDAKDIFNDQYVKIKAEISNTNVAINLGDTLKISLKLPDTVTNGSTNFVVNSLQKGDFAMAINKIDTVNNKPILVLANSNAYWVTKGKFIPLYGYYLSTSNKPYELVINFKPQEKGIYYLDVVTQAGDLEINNNYSARLFVGFNVTNPHLELGVPFFGQEFVSGYNENIARGFGVYAFRVK